MIRINKISVIIATYNGEAYICEQLESIVNQTIRPDEIIISDNMSTDKTVNLCDEFLSQLSRPIYYKILKEKHKGVTKNFENALANSTGDYIFFSDQDDVWGKEKIEKFMVVFNENKQCNCVFSNCSLNVEGTEILIKSLLNNAERNAILPGILNKDSFLNIELRKNIVTGMSLAINKKLKSQVLPFSKYVFHDYWCAINAIFIGEIYYLDFISAYYRQHDNNVVGANSKITIKRLINSLKNHKGKCINDLKFLLEIESKYPIIRNNNTFINLKKIREDRLKNLQKPSLSNLYNILKNKKLYKKYISDHYGFIKDLIYLLFFSGGK